MQARNRREPIPGARNLPEARPPGAAVALFAWLLAGRLRTIGFVFAALLAILWIGRLSGGDADDAALLLPAALAGFVANPVWYVSVARELGRE